MTFNVRSATQHAAVVTFAWRTGQEIYVKTGHGTRELQCPNGLFPKDWPEWTVESEAIAGYFLPHYSRSKLRLIPENKNAMWVKSDLRTTSMQTCNTIWTVDNLVGGFNPFQKYSPIFGMNIKKIFETTT